MGATRRDNGPVNHLVIALDVDGTLYEDGRVAPEAEAEIGRAHAAGHTLVVVTGRRWETLRDVIPGVLDLFACVVAEEGGVLVDMETGSVTLLAPGAESDVITALTEAGIPDLDVGHVAVGAPSALAAQVIDVARRAGSTRRTVINKGSVAIVPEGIDKGTGLRAAIDHLGAQGMPILAIGDAANDLPMFAAATIAVAVANADDAVRAAGIERTSGTAGAGVAEALRRHA